MWRASSRGGPVCVSETSGVVPLSTWHPLVDALVPWVLYCRLPLPPHMLTYTSLTTRATHHCTGPATTVLRHSRTLFDKHVKIKVLKSQQSPLCFHRIRCVRGGVVRPGGVQEDQGQLFQSTALCCVRQFCLFVPMTMFLCLEILRLCDMTMCFSMNDNEGVAEMLIDSLGTTIINTTDSKGR